MKIDEKYRVKKFRRYAATGTALWVLWLMAPAWGRGGLSNEVYLSKQWHDLDATTSITVNPSFASRIDWPTFSTAVSSAQMGLFTLANAQGVIPLSPLAYNSHTLGFAYTGLNAGTVRKSDWRSGEVALGEESAAVGYTEHYGSIVYSFMPFSSVSVGAAFNCSRQSNFGRPITDGAIDVGASVTLESGGLGTHMFGISMLNPASLSRYDNPVFTPDICVSWHFSKRFQALNLQGGFEANYRSFKGENFGTPQREAAARIGAAVNNSVSCFLQGGRRYMGVALQVHLDSTSAKIPKFIRNVSGACQVLFTEAQMRPTSTLYFGGEIKRNRNTISGDMYDIYLKAMKAYNAGRWVDAWPLFTLLAHEVPSFPKIDHVRLCAATCLEKMYLYDRSIAQYKKVRMKLRFRNDPEAEKIVNSADLGLLRLYARKADSVSFRRMLNFMTYSTVNDSLMTHAWYVAGQFALSCHDTVSALEYFSKVRQGHPDFAFAQYAKGVCHVVTNDAEHLIEKSFKEVVECDTRGDAVKEIGYRACYALGCFYYEKNRFADAQRYIERIPEESGVYFDGLSVISWALLKSRQWNRCRISALQMQKSNSAEVQAEGYLLEGYALMCDTICPQSRELCLARALEAADEAVRRIPSLDAYASTDTRRLACENDSLAVAQEKLLDRFSDLLDQGKERAWLFKCIDEIRRPANYCQYRTDINLFNIDLAHHYRNTRSRIGMLREDIQYFSAKVHMLYERERARKHRLRPSAGNTTRGRRKTF